MPTAPPRPPVETFQSKALGQEAAVRSTRRLLGCRRILLREIGCVQITPGDSRYEDVSGQLFGCDLSRINLCHAERENPTVTPTKGSVPHVAAKGGSTHHRYVFGGSTCQRPAESGQPASSMRSCGFRRVQSFFRFSFSAALEPFVLRAFFSPPPSRNKFTAVGLSYMSP